ncbi:MAG: GTP 3',8-cyclase MoaA [Ardenticatenales bacterium]
MSPIALHDGYGRAIDYLRISLTERCNLRCRYCMPTQGLTFAPDDQLLTAAEIETVVRAAASVGFRKVRLTGGEPTLRRDVLDIVARIAAVDGIQDVSMTTNGIRLVEMAGPLKAAGLRRVNVHIDSLDPARLANLMLWGKSVDLWAGIEAAEAAGLVPIKLNCVVARGYNEEDVVDLARLTIERDWTVRFIELMPLGSGAEAQFSIDRYVSNEDVAARITAALGPLTPEPNADAADEARNFRLAGAAGRVGFISPVSAPYCGNCNRMRLTSDGKFHLCLLHDDELDVRATLRGGGGEAAVAAVLARAVATKPIGHELASGVHTEGRRMHAIGG